MNVSKIRIENIQAIEELEFAPGDVTVVSGPNGVGKTSILRAIEALFAGGHDPELIIHGKKKATVVCTLEDGTTITRTITQKSSTVEIETADGRKVQKPQTILKGWYDSVSFSPAKWLEAKTPKEKQAQVDALLEALPMELDIEAIDEAVAVADLGDADVDPGLHPLAAIDQVRKQVFDERTYYNRAAKEARATAKSLEAGLPPKTDGDSTWTQKKEALAREHAEMERTRQELLTSVKDEHSGASQKIDEETAKFREEILAEHAREIERLNAQRDAALGKVNEKRDQRKAKALEARDDALADLEKDFRPGIERLTTELATAAERAEAEARVAEQRRALEAQQQKGEAAEDQAGRLTQAIERLDALKGKLVENLPIEGLEIREGELYLEGTPVSHVNHSRRVTLAFDVACLRAGKLGVITIDEAECMDRETWEELQAVARTRGKQLVVARVTDGVELKVE